MRSGINFGCGTVTVNYDGTAKFRTTIGTGPSIAATPTWWSGEVRRGGYTAAGSTIPTDVRTTRWPARARPDIKISGPPTARAGERSEKTR